MSKNPRRLALSAPFLTCGCSLVALLAPSPAAAQAQGVNTAAPSSAADIVVTARRVEERLQDVPISISVYNQADLTKRNVALPSDLALYTPSLTVNQRFGPEKSSFSIRGFSQDINTAATVGVYFDEVVGVR